MYPRITLQRNPLSLLDVHHNGTSSQMVSIVTSDSAGAFSDIATQQKGDFYLAESPTLLWRNMSTGQNVCWPMDGTNTVNTCGPLVSNWLPPMPAGWTMAGTADFTGNGNNDILWTMPGTTNVLLWTMMGPSFISSNWLRALPPGIPQYGVAGTGDFNGDGKPDILLTNSSGPTIRLMNGTQFVQDIPLSQVPLVATAKIVGVGDFTGSGQADILWRDYIHGTNFIWMMNGTNYSTTAQIDSETDTNWQIQGVGDFNGDGLADIVWRHATSGVQQSMADNEHSNECQPAATHQSELDNRRTEMTLIPKLRVTDCLRIAFVAVTVIRLWRSLYPCRRRRIVCPRRAAW